jgi:hypothetical protein
VIHKFYSKFKNLQVLYDKGIKDVVLHGQVIRQVVEGTAEFKSKYMPDKGGWCGYFETEDVELAKIIKGNTNFNKEIWAYTEPVAPKALTLSEAQAIADEIVEKVKKGGKITLNVSELSPAPEAEDTNPRLTQGVRDATPLREDANASPTVSHEDTAKAGRGKFAKQPVV